MSKPRNDWLKSFLNRGGFGDWLIVEWAVVEQNVDVTLIGEFGLLSFVPPEVDTKDHNSVEAQLREVLKRARRKETQQVGLLLDLPFYKKMEFLKGIRAIKEKEASAINRFRKDRNRCFHGEIWGSSFVKLNDEEKQVIMNRAEKAVDTSYDVLERLLKRLKFATTA